MLDDLRRHAAVAASLRKIAALRFRSPGSAPLKQVAPKAYRMEGPRKLKMPGTVKVSGAGTVIAKTIGKGTVSAGKHLGKFLLNHPEKALLIGAGTIATIGKARSSMAGFNPAVHRAQLGIEP